jgi:hypothetical protein
MGHDRSSIPSAPLGGSLDAAFAAGTVNGMSMDQEVSQVSQ